MAKSRWVNPDERMYPGEPLESIEFVFHLEPVEDAPAELRIALDVLLERSYACATGSSADGGQLDVDREIDPADGTCR